MFNQEDLLELKNIIDRSQTIGSLVGENPDLDTMAAALGLYLSLSQAQKKVSICSQTDPIVELSSLVGIDRVDRELSLGRDLTMSLPYRQGTIEKVSYNIVGDRMNLVIKAGSDGLGFEQSDIRYLKTGGKIDVLFSVGVENQAIVDKILPQDEDGEKTFLVNIDNNSSNDRFGQMTFVDSVSSSKSEIVAYLISSLNLPMDRDSAQNLLSGIDFATNNFQDLNTSSVAFEMAGLLLKQGAQRNGLLKKQPLPINEEFSPEDFFPTLQPKRHSVQSFTQHTASQAPRPAQGRTFPAQKQQPLSGKKKNPPDDWLAPKIYKGSTTI